MYSIKALTADVEEFTEIHTNANGPSVYQKCELDIAKPTCNKFPSDTDTISLKDWLKTDNSLFNITGEHGFVKECDLFWDHFKENLHNAKEQFYRGHVEPQAIIVLSFYDDGESEET